MSPRVLAVLTIVGLAAHTNAQLVGWSLDLVDSGVETTRFVDTDPFLVDGPTVDVWQLSLTNPLLDDITSLELSLCGPFQNNFVSSSPHTFSDTVDLPALLGQVVAETFFVVPPGMGNNPLSANVVDRGTLLAAAYTLEGGSALVPAGDSAVVAVMTTPVGFNLHESSIRWSGQAGVGGVPIDLFVNLGSGPHLECPEPTAAALGCVAIIAVLAKRRSVS